jgi:tetratricopeptide (TPR) repeat protein
MAKDPDYDAIRITNAVQHQMNDIDTFVRNELHLSPERLKKIVTSLAGALISRHFEDLAANRLRQLAGMAHIHNGLVRSEIAYQLGKIYIGQNNAEGLAKLRESVDHARGNPEQLLKCSLAWAEEAEQRGTNIADITDALQGAWDNRAGLPQNEALWSCGHLLGKKYYEQGRMDSAETILRETHTNVPANNKLRVAVARYLVLATDTRAHTPELESLCREVIAGSANDAAQRARFQFILGRAMDSKTNNAEKLTLLRQAHNTMERTTGFTPSELQECAIRLGRALLRARQEQEVAATLLGGAWARNVQLSRRVYVLAAVLWARHLAARGDRAGRGLAGAVYEEMWRAHGSRDLPDDRQPGGDGFWATLLTALGYYANFLSSTRGDSGLLRQVVERGRHIQQQLGLPANAKIEALHQRLNGRAAMRGIPRRRAIAIW